MNVDQKKLRLTLRKEESDEGNALEYLSAYHNGFSGEIVSLVFEKCPFKQLEKAQQYFREEKLIKFIEVIGVLSIDILKADDTRRLLRRKDRKKLEEIALSVETYLMDHLEKGDSDQVIYPREMMRTVGAAAIYMVQKVSEMMYGNINDRHTEPEHKSNESKDSFFKKAIQYIWKKFKGQ